MAQTCYLISNRGMVGTYYPMRKCASTYDWEVFPHEKRASYEMGSTAQIPIMFTTMANAHGSKIVYNDDDWDYHPTFMYNGRNDCKSDTTEMLIGYPN